MYYSLETRKHTSYFLNKLLITLTVRMKQMNYWRIVIKQRQE